MVASKTSILVAAVALGAASVYAAPAPINQDIALSRREADESALIARDFDDDELFAREFLDDLDARDFEDALEARDFDEDELYARELYEDELEARELYEDELEARELYEDELEARGFDDDEDLFARAVEVSPFSLLNPSSAGTPSSTATPSPTAAHSDGTPSPTSTITDATKDKHVLAATSPSTLNSDKKVHRKQHKRPRHDVCKPYRTAYKLLAGEPLGEHKVGEHDLHHHGLHEHAHDLKAHAQDKDRHHRHHQHRHRHQRHHKLTAEEIAHKCGREITALVRFQHHKHDAVVDASTAPKVPETLKVQTSETPKVQTSEALKVQIPETSKVQTPQTLKIQTPTKAKRGLNQLWARVVGRQSDMPAMDTKTAGQGYPDAAGPVNAQSHVLESSPSTPLPGGAENLATTPSLEGQQGAQHPGQYKKHHHHHHPHHRHRNCYRHPNSKACRNRHRHHRHHNRKHPKQDAKGAPALDATKSVTEPNVNGGPVSDATAVGNGAPVPVNPAAGVQRRSLEDEIWERSLANSLGLDEDYFTKRFYDEDAFEF